MPAETHQLTERVDARAVLDFLACALGIDPTGAADVSLAALQLDDDLSIVDLWESVVEEFGERALGDLDLDGTPPATLGEIAELFGESLRS